jgi:hypothetical protein
MLPKLRQTIRQPQLSEVRIRLTIQEKKAVTRRVCSRYQKAGRKEKSAILDEFISITGYKNWKYALRLPSKPAWAQALLFVKGGKCRVLVQSCHSGRGKVGEVIRYSEAFKRRLAGDVAAGKYGSIEETRRRGGGTGFAEPLHWASG